MAKDNSKQKIRVSLDLSETFHDKLTELETLTHAESKATVLRDSLQLTSFLALKSVQGYKFALIAPDGTQETIRLWNVEVSTK